MISKHIKKLIRTIIHVLKLITHCKHDKKYNVIKASFVKKNIECKTKENINEFSISLVLLELETFYINVNFLSYPQIYWNLKFSTTD